MTNDWSYVIGMIILKELRKATNEILVAGGRWEVHANFFMIMDGENVMDDKDNEAKINKVTTKTLHQTKPFFPKFGLERIQYFPHSILMKIYPCHSCCYITGINDSISTSKHVQNIHIHQKNYYILMYKCLIP